MKTTNVVKSILAIVAVAAAATSVNAADNAKSADLSGSVSVGYANENFYRGADIGDETAKVGVSLQGSLGGLSTFGGLVSNQSIGSGSDQYFISAGIASKMFEDSLNVSGGYLHTEGVPGDAIGELFVKASANVLLNPTVSLYYELDDELWTTELGLNHEFDLNVATLCVHAGVGETETSVATDRTYYVVGAKATRSVADNTDLTLSLDRIDADDADDDLVFLAGLTVKF